MTTPSANWRRMRFKKNKVWAETSQDGVLLVLEGRVRIKYQLDQPHEYRVYPEALNPLPAAQENAVTQEMPAAATRSGKTPPAPKKKARPTKAAPEIPTNALSIFTDGASSGNPGPSGIGIVMCWGDHEKEISRFIGEATNNIAELEAIRVGLSMVKKTDLPVRVFTDSSYALGVLTQGWKARKNPELIARIRKEMSRFHDLVFVKVKGHSGFAPNERADRLAVSAIKNAI